ncbi:carbohydrate kinase [Parapedobacter defluvii]|uniref:carbohydrate kinase family protein n=1 Tax=Parapedobacter defluvii TaxID=2045106 RepID=UPI003340FEEF
MDRKKTDMETGRKQVVCYGEVLWDVLPSGRKPGGAPMNVAYHLRRLGIPSVLVSRIGDDTDGRALLDFLSGMGIAIDFVQVDEQYETSRVMATIGRDNEVSYQILEPVAWDFIQYDPRLSTLIHTSDVLVYGSLAARSTQSHATLQQLLDHAKYRLFDVNLRPPHYTPELIDGLFRRADAAKLNSHELAQVSNWLDIGRGSEDERVGRLQERYELGEIIVTKGAQGASYYTPGTRRDFPAIRVSVTDTVGSGDAFLAAFLVQKLQGEGNETLLELATALGAYVTTKTGACPHYSRADLDHFIWENTLRKREDKKAPHN